MRRGFRDALRPMLGALMLLGSLASLFGCGAEETFELSFPSPDAFAAAATVRVFAVPTMEGLEDCPGLLSQAEVGGLTSATSDTGSFPVCDYRSGGVSLPDVENGLFAYVAVAEDAGGQPLLTGCTIRDVYLDETHVRIVLTPTAVYRARVRQGTTPTGCSVEDRCAGRCP